ncbi:LuxR C-terminal-related transcriptional regulator [Lichenicoccus roseus]|uniref:HTH luxR-type domain-containing protein n=1 Tax=Lichenicoccus roseus TaxID=2683649 RepID=A0A5R9JGI8_9PROT|nr:LuxR C-terminal-related transcriptional regulator [Lichenicoccus roseus]TLU74536.1 hypothetical protein FE263_05025 [Lichenicoccus roseus]
MQRYKAAMSAFSCETASSALPPDARIGLVLQRIAQSDQQAQSLPCENLVYELMPPPAVRGYQTADHVDGAARRALNLARLYAERLGGAEQEQSELENTLYEFSRILLGLDCQQNDMRIARPAIPDATSERRRDARRLIATLTTRQRQVMVLVLAGRPNKLIAQDLCISQRTVENHRAAVMARTGSKSLPALARTGLYGALAEQQSSTRIDAENSDLRVPPGSCCSVAGSPPSRPLRLSKRLGRANRSGNRPSA